MFIVLLTVILASGCALFPMEEQSLVPPLVQPTEEELRTMEASLGNIETFLRGTAQFVSAYSEGLSFKENGKLKSINVTPGQWVEEGEVLAELDTGDLEQQLYLRRLDFEKLQLQYMKARESGLTGIDLRMREIDIEKEEIILKSMEERLANTRIVAPFSGEITHVDSGKKPPDNINAFDSIITIQDPSSIQLVYTASNSKDLLALEVGAPVYINYRGVDYTGKLVQTPNSIPSGQDPLRAERNAVKIYMTLDDPPEDVTLGHSATMTIPLQKRENVIVVPRSAVRSYMGRTYVTVLEGEIRRDVDVEVGLQTPTEYEIVKGLEVGQIFTY